MASELEEKNKALMLRAFDTLFNKHDYRTAEQFWSAQYIQHSAHIAPGRDGLFDLIKSLPPTLKYEAGTIVAEGNLVMVHGRFSGFGAPVNWIAADILRIEDGLLVEHWDVIQDEATEGQSKSGAPMFGKTFPKYNETEWLTGDEPMGNEGSYVALGLKTWNAQIDRADKLFGGLSSEEILREIAPGRNRLLYLWGHLTAVHDAMLPLLSLGERLHPEFDVAFVSNPDKSRADLPSHEQVRRAWNVVNAGLRKGFEKMSWSDWVQRHSAVSEEDFAKDASRNRFAILLSRTNHLSYHLGQAVLGRK